MKGTIHPTYYPDAQITCACGAIYITGSIEPKINVEICSRCHPFYTGKQKLVDTARRVEKFQERKAKVTVAAGTRKGKTVKHAVKKAKKIEKKEKGQA